MEEETEAFVQVVLQSVPASREYLIEVKKMQEDDPVCTKVREYFEKGWPPSKQQVPIEITPYFQERHNLTVQENLFVRGNRLVIPSQMRKQVLRRLHDGHQGISRCRQRAKMSVWWPGLSSQMADVVTNCLSCAHERVPKTQPMIASELPERPWQRVRTDLFELKGAQYLLVVDYYSRYVEITRLRQTTSEAVISHLKALFSRHGIPEVLRSDNGPKFSSKPFEGFCKDYKIEHVTSSPRYPQNNGEAERMVTIAKDIIKKSEDPELGLLVYRTTPGPSGYSPAQLLMGRQFRTTLPVLASTLLSRLPNHEEFRKKDREKKISKRKTTTRDTECSENRS